MLPVQTSPTRRCRSPGRSRRAARSQKTQGAECGSDDRTVRCLDKEQESKNWVYDLIKGEDEFVFVAEVPGPEDKIAVRLVDGILYIRGTSGFSKEVPIEGAGNMQIFDFKYRNGVLTLRIK